MPRTHAERYVDGHDVELWRDDTKLALLLREGVVRPQARLSGRARLRGRSTATRCRFCVTM